MKDPFEAVRDSLPWKHGEAASSEPPKEERGETQEQWEVEDHRDESGGMYLCCGTNKIWFHSLDFASLKAAADAHSAALKSAKYGTPELARRVSDLTLENEQFYKRAEKAEAALKAERKRWKDDTDLKHAEEEVRVMTNQCVQLRQELAAERDEHNDLRETCKVQLELIDAEREKLRLADATAQALRYQLLTSQAAIAKWVPHNTEGDLEPVTWKQLYESSDEGQKSNARIIERLEKELLQIQAAIAKHNERCDTHPSERHPPGELKIDVDLSALEQERERVRKPLVNAIRLLLDQVDWVAGNCRVNEMVGAVLDKVVIDKSRAALASVKEQP